MTCYFFASLKIVAEVSKLEGHLLKHGGYGLSEAVKISWFVANMPAMISNNRPEQ